MLARIPIAVFLWCVVASALATQASSQEAAGPSNGLPGQWRYYGGSVGNTKYSPLDQINKDNVAKLRVAWTSEAPDATISVAEGATRPSGRAQGTPLMVGDTLYLSTGLCLLAAVDAQTGKTKWIYDPESHKAGRPGNNGYVHRGFAYWTDGKEERLYLGTHTGWLYAIDCKTGKSVESFGENGRVNLAKAIPRAVNTRNYMLTSPPAVFRDLIIVGSSIHDGPQTKEYPRGDIQAFDIRTGQPRWIFHSVPQAGEFGNETWEEDSWKYTGNTNVWSILTVDDELGYVYCPFGTPTNDWYGGHRPGDNLFGEAIVCLDANTGKRVWHFQTVHHGVWDYDLPAAPILCDIQVDGKPIKAVAQITKVGFCWVFDRVTGKPVWPVEERPVPPSQIPGEELSPTQPFPTKPAPYETQGSIEENMIDWTPELRQQAIAILNNYDHGPLFTPPTERGTINSPGWNGGANWWGAAWDPDTGNLFIPSITGPIVVRLVKPDPARSNFNYIRGNVAYTGGPDGLPLFKPPYGRITAINLNSGEHSWQIPHGDGPRARVSEVVGFDVGPLGAGGTGPLATKTLLFVGQGPLLRAFDKKTGEVVATVRLPGPAGGTPMTYLAGGKQYIAINAGGGRVTALCLPAGNEPASPTDP